MEIIYCNDHWKVLASRMDIQSALSPELISNLQYTLNVTAQQNSSFIFIAIHVGHVELLVLNVRYRDRDIYREIDNYGHMIKT